MLYIYFFFFLGGGVLNVDINELDLYIGNNKFTIFNVDYWLLIILDMIIITFWLWLYDWYKVIKSSVLSISP